jgi:hypothetical protein
MEEKLHIVYPLSVAYYMLDVVHASIVTVILLFHFYGHYPLIIVTVISLLHFYGHYPLIISVAVDNILTIDAHYLQLYKNRPRPVFLMN